MDFSTHTDLELLEMLRNDDRKAFAELYHRYAPALLGHAYQRVSDRDEAKDIVQDVFASLWDKRAQLSIHYSLASFLFTSVRNIILNKIAREEVAGRYLSSMTEFAKAGSHSADREIREKEFALLIESEISRLTPRTREVFELSRRHYLSHQAIAIRLGMSEQTVSKHITNALRILRGRLSSFGTLLLLNIF